MGKQMKINESKCCFCGYGLNPDEQCKMAESLEAKRVYEAELARTDSQFAALAAVWIAARNCTASYYEKEFAITVQRRMVDAKTSIQESPS